jgi:hypothetical protein
MDVMESRKFTEAASVVPGCRAVNQAIAEKSSDTGKASGTRLQEPKKPNIKLQTRDVARDFAVPGA